ncbi:MAG: hypothetical protein Q8Q42_03425 [Nanoarchaeota archaeon]|nr:hypothetical protein [Nanoarchaeota archaeon]
MKVILFITILLSLFLIGCASTSSFYDRLPFGKSDEKNAGLNMEEPIPNLGPNKGVLLGFQKGNPPNMIRRDFDVALDAVNYMPEDVSGSFDLWSTNNGLEGFEKVEGGSFNVGSAIYENDVLVKPTLTSPFSQSTRFSNIRDGSTTQFKLIAEYDVNSVVDFNFCLTSPKGDYDSSCKSSETLSGLKLGNYNSQYPVTVSSIRRDFSPVGETTDLRVTLLIQLSNVGGGKVNTGFNTNKRILDFDIFGPVNFECWSDDILDKSGKNGPGGSSSISVEMEKSSVDVVCDGKIGVNRPRENINMRIKTSYGYEIQAETPVIKVEG